MAPILLIHSPGVRVRVRARVRVRVRVRIRIRVRVRVLGQPATALRGEARRLSGRRALHLVAHRSDLLARHLDEVLPRLVSSQ